MSEKSTLSEIFILFYFLPQVFKVKNFFFGEFWDVSNFGENFICGKIFCKNWQKRANLELNAQNIHKYSQKSNFMPKSRNFGKICKNMLNQVGLISLRIFWIAKEILICSKICKRIFCISLHMILENHMIEELGFGKQF